MSGRNSCYRPITTTLAVLLGMVLLMWCVPAQAVQRSFLNNGFETINGSTYSGGLVNYCWVGQSILAPWLSNDPTAPNTNCNAVGGPGVSGTGNIIEIWLNGFLGVPPRSGRVFAELNANTRSTLHQNVCVLQNEDITWRLSHRGRSGTDTMEFYVGASATGRIIRASTTTAGVTAINFCQDGSNVSTVSTCTQATTGTWGDYGGVFKWLGNSGVTSINFEAITAGTVGNFLDEVYFYLKPIVEFSASSSSGLESVAAPAAPRLRVVGSLTSPLTVKVSIIGGTAVLGTDYTTPNGTANFDVIIPAGSYTETALFATGITINNDKIANGDRTIIMKVNADSAYIISSSQVCGSSVSNPATYTILDDDANVRLINTTIGGTDTFTYSISNVDDTDLVAAGIQNGATITTTAANTPVEYDTNSGTAGIQPIVVTTVGAAITVTQTIKAGWSVSGSCSVSGGSNPTSSPIAVNTLTGAVTIPAANVTAGSTTTCSFINTNVLSLTKAFSASTIGVGQKATLTYTITNPTSGTAKTGLTFTDSFTGTANGLVIASPPNVVNNCLGTTPTATAGDGFFTVAAGVNADAGPSSCTLSVDVTSSTPGSYVNGAANITALSPLLTNGVTNQTLNVTQAGLDKSFNPTTIDPGGTSTLTFILANGTGNPAQSGINFTDNMNTNIKVAATPAITSNCPSGGSFTANPAFVTATLGTSAITVTGAAMNSGVSGCQITVNVTSNMPGGPYNNANSNIVSEARITKNVVSSGLTVQSLSLTKSFNTGAIVAGGTARLTYAIQNPSGSAARTGGMLTFTDTFPVGLVIASTPNVVSTCGGTAPTAAAGDGFFTVGTSPGVGGVDAVIGPSTCTISVNVTSSTPKTYINGNAQITAISGMSNGVTDQALDVLKLVATKSFLTPSIGIGDTSTLQITLQNTSSTDITGAAFTDNYGFGANLVNSGVQNAIGGSGCTGALAGANGGQSLTLTGAKVPANSTCTYSISVTSPTAGSYLNSTGTITTANAGSTAAASATLVVTPPGTTVSGTVYSDVNHNGTLDVGEGGTGQTLYVKLISGGCSGAFAQAVAATPATGAYSLSGVAAGSYCLLLSTNNNADTTSGSSSGWLALEGAGGRLISVTATPLTNQNFGLYNGSRVTGRVIADTGVGGGTANNGIQEGSETGIGGTVVKTTDAGGVTVYDSATTGGSGDFILWIPASAGTGTVKIVETNPGGYISTGGNAGTSGGNYDRTTDTVTFTNAVGTSFSGLLFADVPDNRFLTDNAATALPGATVFHPHSFTAGSAGTVTFSATATASPAVPGWGEVFYRDSNCSGTFDAGEPQITAAISMTAGEQLCLLVKEFVPANAPVGASNQVTVSAMFSYTNASPALSRTHTRTDTTTVGTASGAGLTLTKTVDKATALPGTDLTYTITYGNSSTGPLNNIIIHDSVPSFTALTVSPPNPCCVNPVTACLGTGVTPFPASIISCVPSIVGDAITWTLNGSLAPGASGQVKFKVTVQP